MLIRRALRTLAATVAASTLALTVTAAPANAAMTPEMEAAAAARMKEIATQIAGWQAANPGKTYTLEQFAANFPNPAPADGVVHYVMFSAAPGYCFVAGDSMEPLPSTTDGTKLWEALQKTRFLDSTTAEVFKPDFSLFSESTPQKACYAVLKNAVDNASDPEKLKAGTLVTSPTPFHASLVPPPVVQPPVTQPPVTQPPAIDPATVRAAMVKDVKKAKRLITKAQKKKAKARPTLKQLRKAGLKPSAGTKVAVKYDKKKPKLYCVRATNPDAGLAKGQAVWWDSGLKKVVTGKKPKGRKSACAKLM